MKWSAFIYGYLCSRHCFSEVLHNVQGAIKVFWGLNLMQFLGTS